MRNYLRSVIICTLCFIFAVNTAAAQDKKFPTPREETLLNGLKILILPQPNSGKVSVKLRIHSGSAFDPQDKEGTMALLSDIIFPNEAIKTYFEEDLEGSLEVLSTYDYIQINATAKTAEFLAVMETLAPAVISPQIDKETLAKIKPNRLAIIKEKENYASYIAERTVAERLYGEFPYGRPQIGTPESIAVIDFADLIFAKQKFLTADNATIIISGDVDANYAYKAVRRLLGGWQKSLNKVPANFRLPFQPDTTPLTVNIDESNTDVKMFAFDSVARNDKDYFAATVLEKILNNRSKITLFEDLAHSNQKVTNNVYFLRGYFVISKDVDAEKLSSRDSSMVNIIPDPKADPNQKEAKTGYNLRETANLFRKPVTKDEFNAAKAKVLAELKEKNPADFWLDVNTYKLGSISGELEKASKVTVNDVQKVLTEFGKRKIVEISVESVGEQTIDKDNKENEQLPLVIVEADPKDPQ